MSDLQSQLPSGPDPFSTNAEDISVWQIFKIMLLGIARVTIRLTKGTEHGAGAVSNTAEMGEIWTETGVYVARHAQNETLLKHEGKAIRLQRALNQEKAIPVETPRKPARRRTAKQKTAAKARKQEIHTDDV